MNATSSLVEDDDISSHGNNSTDGVHDLGGSGKPLSPYAIAGIVIGVLSALPVILIFLRTCWRIFCTNHRFGETTPLIDEIRRDFDQDGRRGYTMD